MVADQQKAGKQGRDDNIKQHTHPQKSCSKTGHNCHDHAVNSSVHLPKYTICIYSCAVGIQ